MQLVHIKLAADTLLFYFLNPLRLRRSGRRSCGINPDTLNSWRNPITMRPTRTPGSRAGTAWGASLSLPRQHSGSEVPTPVWTDRQRRTWRLQPPESLGNRFCVCCNSTGRSQVSNAVSSSVPVIKARNSRPEDKKCDCWDYFFFIVLPAGDRTAGRLEQPPRFWPFKDKWASEPLIATGGATSCPFPNLQWSLQIDLLHQYL